MNNKDLGFFQQHIEKIVLGIGGVVLIGVGATQFLLGQPNAIEVNNKVVSPDEIKDNVTRPAQTLAGRLDQPSPLPEIVIPKYSQSFIKLFDLDVATNQQLAAIDNTGLADEFNVIVSPDYPTKFLPTPPLPIDVLAKKGHGVLADDGSDLYLDFLEFVSSQPDRPVDFPYVSVSAEFSFEDLVARYESTDIPGDQRIDEGLWRERLAITSVQLYREELDPVTGEWGAGKLIDPMPGQFALVPTFNESLPFERAQALEQKIQSSQAAIRRPEFPSIHNGPWTPPNADDRVLNSEEIKKRDELEQQIRKLERQLARLRGVDNDRSRSSSRNRSRERRATPDFQDFGGDPFGGGLERSGRSDRSRDRDRANDERRAEREAARITETQQQLAEAKTELNKLLGIDDDASPNTSGSQLSDPSLSGIPADFFGDPFGASGGFDPSFTDPNFGGGFSPATSRSRGSAAADTPESVKVWAHDLSVEPGKTYRYKVLVSVMNPLYNFTRLNETQLEENRNRISLGPSQEEIDAAEWSASATVEIDPVYYFFVDSANKDQKRANIEVWTVYDGLWRRSEFTEYPGNEVGGIVEIDGLDTKGLGVQMNAGPIMLDVDSVSVANGSSAVRVLFMDPESNQIITRLVNEDKNSEERKLLEIEADKQQRLLDQLSTARP
ncbi:MAG: hypothetical protein AAGH99_07375 [Planctomycetota bacterium]